MKSTSVAIPNINGQLLNARIDMSESGIPVAYCLFAHCFTCSSSLKPVGHISDALTNNGVAVVRFDFTGLGRSDGEFADTNFSSNIEDLLAVAEYMAKNLEGPQLLIGHSLGGAAVIHAASQIESVKAVATINAPSEPSHVRGLLTGEDEDQIIDQGEAKVKIGGRPFTIKKQFLDDLDQVTEQTANLGRALLVLHTPVDNVVGIENAGQLFAAARHPKSFVALDGADHLLTDEKDAAYAGSVIATWFTDYQTPKPLQETSPADTPSADVTIVETSSGYRTDVTVGRHQLVVDEPESVGGSDDGPTPYGYLLAALGSCTSITLRMYADRKKLPLESVKVSLTHSKVHAKDCAECETETGMVDVIVRTIELNGPLNDEQRQRLLVIADKCPVHRTLTSETRINTTLV